MRFILALKCFFLVLFKKRLPAEAAALLPPPAQPEPPSLPVREAELVSRPAPGDSALTSTPPLVSDEVAAARPGGGRRSDDRTRGAVQLLAILQREGRLLDFLQEEIDAYSDAQVGAAVRDIHRGCKKALAEHVPLEPVLQEPENAPVRIDAGYDPSRIRVVGNVMGEPPYAGTLKHHGWRTAKVSLPVSITETDGSVVAPAEVEIA